MSHSLASDGLHLGPEASEERLLTRWGAGGLDWSQWVGLDWSQWEGLSPGVTTMFFESIMIQIKSRACDHCAQSRPLTESESDLRRFHTETFELFYMFLHPLLLFVCVCVCVFYVYCV